MTEKILKLKGIVLDKLPQNFSFQGTLDLSGSSILELPENLYVEEDLIITNTKINSLPKGVIVGRNLICADHTIEKIDESATVCGKMIFKDKEYNCYSTHPFVLLSNGDRFYYKRKTHYSHRALNHQYDRTPFDLYQGYLPNTCAVAWKTPQGSFIKLCKNIAEAKLFVNYQDAVERGLLKYLNQDIDTPLPGKEILTIYQVCTNACQHEVENFLKMFNLSLDGFYTLREIGYKVQKFKALRYAPASEVFMTFFNIPEYKEEAE